jgi:hypothetical protein
MRAIKQFTSKQHLIQLFIRSTWNISLISCSRLIFLFLKNYFQPHFVECIATNFRNRFRASKIKFLWILNFVMIYVLVTSCNTRYKQRSTLWRFTSVIHEWNFVEIRSAMTNDLIENNYCFRCFVRLMSPSATDDGNYILGVFSCIRKY